MIYRNVALMLVALALGATTARADLIVSEIDAAGSGAAYGADWFEVTNTGGSAVNISGWKMDDSSNVNSSAVAIRTISTSSIGPGQSVVFAESNTSGSNDATIQAAFINAWFGGTAPAGFAMYFYGGSGVGLSTSAGDGVNLFDAGGTHMVGASFGILSGSATLDNSALLPDGSTLSVISVAGVNGAFNNGTEIGSPGTITNPVPEPASLTLLALGGAGLWMRRRRA